MTNGEVTAIVTLMTPRAGGLVPGSGHKSHIVKMHYFFKKNSFSSLGDGSDKHKKTVMMMFLLIPIVLTGYIAGFPCHCRFLFIL